MKRLILVIELDEDNNAKVAGVYSEQGEGIDVVKVYFVLLAKIF